MRVLGDWLLTPQRVAVHLPSATGVVADLHLGYGQARRAAGEAVPAPALGAQLAPLREALARHGARRLVVAGDLLEDGRRAGPVLDELAGWLAGAGVELAGLVPGNHDRGLAAGSGLRVCRRGFALGGWRVVHGDATLPEGRLVQGHEHPCVRWPGLPTAPCYLVAEGRLVLPAYSPDAAGVNVVGAPRWAAYRCAVIAGDAVLDFGEVRRLRSLAYPPPRGKA
jgi:metallophosphoesterase superfamily enzyme